MTKKVAEHEGGADSRIYRREAGEMAREKRRGKTRATLIFANKYSRDRYVPGLFHLGNKSREERERTEKRRFAARLVRMGMEEVEND